MALAEVASGIGKKIPVVFSGCMVLCFGYTILLHTNAHSFTVKYVIF